MNNKILLLTTIPVLSCLLASCGTIGGMGKDLQYVGKKMEASEHRRIFPPRAPAAQDGSVQNVADNQSFQPVEPVPMNPDYPTYPTYAPQ